MNVVVTGSRVDCAGPSSHVVSVVSGTGYLSSVITASTGVGAAGCPWLLRARPGQRISLSLLDFTVAGRRPPPSQSAENEAMLKPPPSSQRCVRLAVIREVSGTYRRGDREICSLRVGDAGRERSVYLSDSNELEVVITSQYDVDISHDDDNPIFLLRYDGTSRDNDVTAGARRHSLFSTVIILDQRLINVFSVSRSLRELFCEGLRLHATLH